MPKDLSTNTSLLCYNLWDYRQQKEVFSMKNTYENKPEFHICMGIVAHVDAGKTTLAESLLYHGGSISKPGRVDHQDAFLDTYELEKARGITIFSKQAELDLGRWAVTLLDTPGHGDFSAEMERTLQVLDYAILVISGADGVQGHVRTLWRLLKTYKIPVFLFVNKMDQEGTDKKALLEELQRELDGRCLDFDESQNREEFFENLAVCDERILEEYLDRGEIEEKNIRGLVKARKVFPVYFGSALKQQGIEEFIRGLDVYMQPNVYEGEFGARIYKISRDEKGNRLTHMKITGGCLKVKMPLTNRKTKESGEDVWEEKADQIRIYSGADFRIVPEALPGTICAVTGLSKTRAGQGLGEEAGADMPVLEPVLTYQIQLPHECDPHQMLLNLRQLEEEEPALHIVWESGLQEIHAKVMGEIQIEILKSIIWERFHVAVEFGTGNIVYKETIRVKTEGIGHYEPLRHYAEVHLLLEPGEPGSGLEFASTCSEDVLDRNWQRLILTHLGERRHPGVLVGGEITDMKIILIGGRAHTKHTEGGDFRQATYRAVRQGLKSSECILLEPVYEFRLELPGDKVGRALSDIQKMHGTFQPPEIQGDRTVIRGSAPVVTMRDYQREVLSYTGGQGHIFCSLKGYEPCHNQDDVIEAVGYDSEADRENPTCSVFCAHGAGFLVPWNQVREYMHVECNVQTDHPAESASTLQPRQNNIGSGDISVNEKELEEIFARTYGSREKSPNQWNRKKSFHTSEYKTEKNKKQENLPEYLLVDGYNIIFAWEELRELAQKDVAAAREKLLDILSNYQGYRKSVVIVVFDAYKVEGGKGESLEYKNLYVVYTKEAETADQYIEKTVHAIGKKYQVTVATSDALEQIIIMGQGAGRMSAEGLREAIEETEEELRTTYLNKEKGDKNYLFQDISKDLAVEMEAVRLGKKTFE